MSSPIGNRFWEVRSTHGRKPIFATPEELWAACCEYFEWNEANPLWETKSYMYQGAPVQDQLPKMRAMTITALCIFLDISDTCWQSYRKREGFVAICSRVEEIIYTQKFQGAAADFLNVNIIARELGLKEQVSNEQTGKDGGPIEINQTVTLSDVKLKVHEILAGRQST